MVMISIPEEIVRTYDTEVILSWLEGQLKTAKQISTKKEEDKSFVLGQVSMLLGEMASVVSELRKKLDPKSKEESPVVAG